MVELAEKMIETVTHADWALFAKNGTDATSAALLIARAHTGRRRVLVASGAYHGSAPWCTPLTNGVLPEERAHRAEYKYNDVASLEMAAAAAGDDLAAIFATPIKHDLNTDGELPLVEYARRCRGLCDSKGALLVVDDIRTGLRLARDCSWTLMGVSPDISCWGKAIANGHPLSAVLGADSARRGASKILVGGSYWLQATPMAAAIATLGIIEETNYLEHMIDMGNKLRFGLDERATAHGFELRQTGPVQMPMILFKQDPDFRFGVAFSAGMVQRGIIFHPFHNLFICAAMTEKDIDQTIQAADETFADMASRRSKILPNLLLTARSASLA
jgi:glutamate-1-semialdehyde 2,1-aminomutase